MNSIKISHCDHASGGGSKPFAHKETDCFVAPPKTRLLAMTGKENKFGEMA